MRAAFTAFSTSTASASATWQISSPVDGSIVAKVLPDSLETKRTGFWTGPDGKKLANKPTDFLTMVPSLFNADTLGTRPDLVGGRDQVKSWGDLLENDEDYASRDLQCAFKPGGHSKPHFLPVVVANYRYEVADHSACQPLVYRPVIWRDLHVRL